MWLSLQLASWIIRPFFNFRYKESVCLSTFTLLLKFVGVTKHCVVGYFSGPSWKKSFIPVRLWRATHHTAQVLTLIGINSRPHATLLLPQIPLVSLAWDSADRAVVSFCSTAATADCNKQILNGLTVCSSSRNEQLIAELCPRHNLKCCQKSVIKV